MLSDVGAQECAAAFAANTSAVWIRILDTAAAGDFVHHAIVEFAFRREGSLNVFKLDIVSFIPSYLTDLRKHLAACPPQRRHLVLQLRILGHLLVKRIEL